MATSVLDHGAGDVGRYWHLVDAELHARGHDAISPDLSCDDSADLPEYADTVAEAIGDRTQPDRRGAIARRGFIGPLAYDRVALVPRAEPPTWAGGLLRGVRRRARTAR